MRCRITVLLLALAMSLPVPVQADCDFQSTKHLAEILTLQRRHREAELEYERLAVSCSAPSEKSEALARAMDAALATGDYTFSLKFARVWLNDLKPEQSCSLVLGETKSLYGLGNDEAVLRQSIPDSCPLSEREELTYIKGLCHMRLHQWDQAASHFASLHDSATLNAKAQAAKTIVDRAVNIRWKSPSKAAGLSAVFPGSGYLYAHRPQTALAAFVLNGLFIGGTYSAAHAHEPGLAALLGLFSAGWYFGGVRGSAEAARHTNNFEMHHLLDPVDILR